MQQEAFSPRAHAGWRTIKANLHDITYGLQTGGKNYERMTSRDEVSAGGSRRRSSNRSSDAGT